MLVPEYSPAFPRDYKKCAKRHWDTSKLDKAIEHVVLSDEKKIPQTYKDHALKGDLQGSRELHVSGDWLLLYRTDGRTVVFMRTGTHDELFR